MNPGSRVGISSQRREYAGCRARSGPATVRPVSAAMAATPSPGCRRTPTSVAAPSPAAASITMSSEWLRPNTIARAVALPDSSRAARARLSSTRSWWGSPESAVLTSCSACRRVLDSVSRITRSRLVLVRRVRSEASRTARSSRRMSISSLPM